MAERPYTITWQDVGAPLIIWAGLLNGDTGAAYKGAAGYPKKRVQVSGTFGAGGAVRVQGSMFGQLEASPVFDDMQDESATPLTFSVAGARATSDLVVQIRPEVTAGDATTDLTVRLLMKD